MGVIQVVTKISQRANRVVAKICMIRTTDYDSHRIYTPRPRPRKKGGEKDWNPESQ